MSRREDIDNAVWSDPDFCELTPESKLVYIWSFTNPRCGMAGLYKVSRGAIILECTLSPERVEAAMDELHGARFLFYDGGVIWVRTRVKHLRTRTTQMATAIARDVEKIAPDNDLRRQFLTEYHDAEWLLGALGKLNLAGEPHPRYTRTSPEPHPRYT